MFRPTAARFALNAAGKPKPALGKDLIKYWNIAKGDTVRVISGVDKGAEGKVVDITKHMNQLIVEGVRMKRSRVPELFLSGEEKSKDDKFMNRPQPVHYSDVRLVAELPDAEGNVRKVIVKKIKRGPLYYDKNFGRLTWSRIIPGENKTLPWPRKAPEIDKNHPQNTPTAIVEGSTWVPTLHTSPIPESVRDELRNKYSKYKRPTPVPKITSPAMPIALTELQVANREARIRKRLLGDKPLSEDVMDLLEQKMKNHGVSLPA
ncbi:hypothetical protein SAICODRAFT_22316 [Saitoella complicata NRRL Y-17804]|uniref:KOW domain-containing protein n=1 Tax=Saitoella complicata (strain BCRC 22490 / CBS 7301 / JCM 7358 / NBRC 10748 / NRRL Y-17804) TaxID=698492 RepID=A0A0E9NE84_SAICN|nr:uncharacterized protein SAICODRAFT_22316 [Saitoella complicata NRRL Y-17804]ODQ49620.1 hypothetical protein SAICODRAFT_22316 [Saitoella complicata NRRL Y-17804]GAO48159.1 hypothetical protein G7K_2339-t1 [Saitoella complicata NRRL Y-17804]